MPGEKPPQPKPEWLDSAKQPEAEQRWREAIYELSNENWPLFTEMVRLQAQGKFRELFAAVDKTPLPPVETDEAEGIVAMPAAAHELINNATKKDHDLAAAFEKISKEVKGYPRLKFLITWLYPDTPDRKKVLGEMERSSEFNSSFYSFELLDQTRKMDYQDLRTRLGRLDFPKLISHEETYNQRVRELEEVYKKKVQPPKVKDKLAVKQMLNMIAADPSLYGRYQSGGKDHSFFYGKGNPSKGPLTTVYINPRLEEAGVVFKIIDDCLKDRDAQAKFHDETLEAEAETPGHRPNDKIVVYFGGDDHQGLSTFLSKLNEKQEEILPLLEPEQFQATMEDFRIPLAPGMTFVERNDQSSWDTSKHLLLQNPNYFDSIFDKWWPRLQYKGEKPQNPSENDYRFAARLNNRLGATRQSKIPGLRKLSGQVNS